MSGEAARIAGRSRALAVRAPAAKALGVDVEAVAAVEAEPDPIILSAEVVDAADAADHRAPRDGGSRHEIEREEVPVRACLGSARAAVEPFVAEAGHGLDVADHRPDVVLHEFERAGDMLPLAEWRDFEARAVALPPHACRTDELPGRDHLLDIGRLKKALERKHLRARTGILGKPGEIIRLGLPFRNGSQGRGRKESRQRKRCHSD